MLVLGLLLVRTQDRVAGVRRDGAHRDGVSLLNRRTATIPNVTSKGRTDPRERAVECDLAAMFAIGASIGGLVTALAGRDFALSSTACRSSCRRGSSAA